MTTDEALARLRPDWALSRDEDYATDADGWAVDRINSGEIGYRLGWGATVEAAILAAEATVTREAQEEIERRADRERRREAGQLTPFEIAMEQAASLWESDVMAAVNESNVLAPLTERAFEAAARQGHTIRINGPERVT